ncbi:MAG: hypothetical protein PHP64_05995 [Actinomycetota bacterium]|nr:hypothetical protein [Actinomycetota bacterium]
MSKFFKSLDLFDALALGVLLIFLFLSLANWSKFPIFRDIYYHMGCARSFATAGGIPLHDFWDFAPAGRPHLYPPLLHILMYLLFACKVSMSTIGKIVSFAAFHLILISCWYGIRTLFASRDAFYSSVLLCSCFIFYWQTAVTSAASLVLFLTPFVFVSFEKKRYVASSILLSLAFYSHLTLGHLIAFSLLIYALHRREILKKALLVLAGSYLLWIPWGIHIVLNVKSVSLSSPMSGAEAAHVHLLIWAIGIFGLVYCYFKKERFYILPSLLYGMVPIVFFYAHRFWDGHVFLPLAMLGGVGLSGLHGFIASKLSDSLQKARLAKFCCALFVFPVVMIVLFVDPVLAFGEPSRVSPPRPLRPPLIGPGLPGQQNIPPPGGGLEPALPGPKLPRRLPPGVEEYHQPATEKDLGLNLDQSMNPNLPQVRRKPVEEGQVLQRKVNSFRFRKTTLSELISPSEEGQREGMQSLAAEPILNGETEELARLVERESKPDQIIASTDPSLGNLITGLTARPSTGGMFSEVQAEEEGMKVEYAYLVILPEKTISKNFNQRRGKTSSILKFESLDLEPVGKRGNYCLYRNSSARGIRSEMGTVVPWIIAFPALSAFVLVLAFDCIKMR